LLESVLDWAVALNSRYITDIIYIDFQKAFDSVSHQTLITKLEGYGICGDLLEWFKAFLSNRTQVVNILGHLSDSVHITSGVPKRRYYLAAHRRVVNVLTSNSAFLIFVVLVVCSSHSRPYKMF